ncbi:MAG TPA: hypothetical protein VGB92_10550 [Longimicrobium sp.]|jgi:hypothetical protein
MNAKLLLFGLAALPGCATVQSVVSTETYGGMQVSGSYCPEKVAFVLDLSGSMEGREEIGISRTVTGAAQRTGNRVSQQAGQELGGVVRRTLGVNVSKLTAAKANLIRVLNGLYISPNRSTAPPERTRRPRYDTRPRAQFHLIGFGAQTEAWREGFARADDRARAQLWVGTRSAGGHTPAHAALRTALALPGVNTIFLLSDGHPTDSSPQTILADVRRMNGGRRVRINTIGVGTDQDVDFLCRLAEENNGTYTRDGNLRCGKRPLVIFVGGAADESHRSMLETFCIFDWDGFDKEYYDWTRTDDVRRSIRERRAAFPGVPIAVVGHSYGGDTGYNAVNSLSGTSVNLLVTLDPVSNPGRFDRQMPLPANVSRWINIWVGTEAISLAGGHWEQQRHATIDRRASASQAGGHGDAGGMFAHPLVRSALCALTPAGRCAGRAP